MAPQATALFEGAHGRFTLFWLGSGKRDNTLLFASSLALRLSTTTAFVEPRGARSTRVFHRGTGIRTRTDAGLSATFVAIRFCDDCGAVHIRGKTVGRDKAPARDRFGPGRPPPSRGNTGLVLHPDGAALQR